MVAELWADKDPAEVGKRVLQVVRATLVTTAILFFGLSAVSIDIPAQIWLLPAVTAFAAQLICRRPERRVPDFGWVVFVTGFLSTLAGVLGSLTGPDPMTVATTVIGSAAMLLSFLWREGNSHGGTR